MSKKCGSCGAPAPDNSAVFCNRCGARLPADEPAYILTCRKCGTTITDRQSQFCDRCGSPLAPVVQAVQAIRPVQPVEPVKPVQAEPQAAPAAKGTICRSCGFENSGENRFYCKKCGAYMPKKGPSQKYGLTDDGSDRRLMEGSIRIRPDGMDALRQKPAYKPVEAQELPRPRRHKPPKKKSLGSYRNVALGAAGLIILIIIIIAVIAPNVLNAGSANETASGVKAPGLFDALPFGSALGAAPFSNQATPVVTDSPPIP
jgi:ribosomal protein L40E